jgi:hypothetical protein
MSVCHGSNYATAAAHSVRAQDVPGFIAKWTYTLQRAPFARTGLFGSGQAFSMVLGFLRKLPVPTKCGAHARDDNDSVAKWPGDAVYE